MAEFVKIANEYKRLCDAFETCKDCPLNDLVKNTPNCETGVFRRYPEDAESIIMQWATEHPIKTNRDKFKEVFGLDYFDPFPGGCSAWLTDEYKGGQDSDVQRDT